MADLAYILSILLALTLYGLIAFTLWQVVEGVHWIYCKVTGRKY